MVWTNIVNNLPPFLKLSAALRSYINFIAVSLEQQTVSSLTQEHILMLLLELMSEQIQSSIQIDKRINLAKAYLDDHISTKVSLLQVASASHLSVRQLSQLFKQQLGLSPQQYLREKRMKKAVNLLTQSDNSIQIIAEEVGYQSLSAFSDRFRQHFGRSPSYFRLIDKNKR